MTQLTGQLQSTSGKMLKVVRLKEQQEQNLLSFRWNKSLCMTALSGWRKRAL